MNWEKEEMLGKLGSRPLSPLERESAELIAGRRQAQSLISDSQSSPLMSSSQMVGTDDKKEEEETAILDYKREKEDEEEQQYTPEEVGIMASKYPYSSLYRNLKVNKQAGSPWFVLQNEGRTIALVPATAAIKSAGQAKVAAQGLLRQVATQGLVRTINSRGGRIAQNGDPGVVGGGLRDFMPPSDPAANQSVKERSDSDMQEKRTPLWQEPISPGEFPDHDRPHDPKSLQDMVMDDRTTDFAVGETSAPPMPLNVTDRQDSDMRYQREPKTVMDNVLKERETDMKRANVSPWIQAQRDKNFASPNGGKRPDFEYPGPGGAPPILGPDVGTQPMPTPPNGGGVGFPKEPETMPIKPEHKDWEAIPLAGQKNQRSAQETPDYAQNRKKLLTDSMGFSPGAADMLMEKIFSPPSQKPIPAETITPQGGKVAVTPPGMENVVQELKKSPGVENPWAVAWSMYDRKKGQFAGPATESGAYGAVGQEPPPKEKSWYEKAVEPIQGGEPSQSPTTSGPEQYLLKELETLETEGQHRQYSQAPKRADDEENDNDNDEEKSNGEDEDKEGKCRVSVSSADFNTIVADIENRIAKKFERQTASWKKAYGERLMRSILLAADRQRLNQEPCNLKMAMGDVLEQPRRAGIPMEGMDGDAIYAIVEAAFQSGTGPFIKSLIRQAMKFMDMPQEAFLAIEADTRRLNPVDVRRANDEEENDNNNGKENGDDEEMIEEKMEENENGGYPMDEDEENGEKESQYASLRRKASNGNMLLAASPQAGAVGNARFPQLRQAMRSPLTDKFSKLLNDFQRG